MIKEQQNNLPVFSHFGEKHPAVGKTVTCSHCHSTYTVEANDVPRLLAYPIQQSDGGIVVHRHVYETACPNPGCAGLVRTVPLDDLAQPPSAGA